MEYGKMFDRSLLFKELMTMFGLEAVPQSLIGGELIEGTGETIILEDPYTRLHLAEYADCGPMPAEQACTVAEEVQKRWFAKNTAATRGNIMQAIASKIDANAEDLAKLEALVAGKPIRDCRIEIAKVVEMFRYYAGWTDKLHGEVIPVPSGHLNYTLRDPLGVIFQITPWNAPIFTAGWQIAPAIATGNGVVIKPSEWTPVTTLALVKLAEQAGLPKGLVNVVAGFGETAGEAAIAHPAVRKVVFVGSPAIGRRVATAAGRALKPVILELGGKSANIVFADADLRAACQGVQAAIFSAAGQSCVAGSRLLVEAKIQDEFIAMVSASMRQIKLGDPLEETTEMGPIGNQRQFANITKWIETAHAEGGVIDAAEHSDNKGLFVAPTILKGLTPQSQAVQNEIFGPVVTPLSFRDEAEAIAIANATDFALAGAVWTRDVGRAHHVAAQVRAGTFWINSYKTLHVASPFGGSHSSGFGRSSGSDVLMEYTAPKSVWVKTTTGSKISFGYV